MSMLPTRFLVLEPPDPERPPFLLLRPGFPRSTQSPPPLLQEVPGKQRGEGGRAAYGSALLLRRPRLLCAAPPLSACGACTPTPPAVTWSHDLQPLRPSTPPRPHSPAAALRLVQVPTPLRTVWARPDANLPVSVLLLHPGSRQKLLSFPEPAPNWTSADVLPDGPAVLPRLRELLPQVQVSAVHRRVSSGPGEKVLVLV